MLSRDECLAYLETAVKAPETVPPLHDWVHQNLESPSSALDRHDFLTLKHRGFVGARRVLERLGKIEPSDRRDDQFDFHQTHCYTCGQVLFWALPGKTTRAEIVAFAELIGDEEMKTDQWIHLGVVCPKGCTTILMNITPRAPDARAPDARAPDARAPDARAPDARAPDARAPDARAPDD